MTRHILGVWRSLEARFLGMEEAPSSNLGTSTITSYGEGEVPLLGFTDGLLFWLPFVDATSSFATSSAGSRPSSKHVIHASCAPPTYSVYMTHSEEVKS